VYEATSACGLKLLVLLVYLKLRVYHRADARYHQRVVCFYFLCLLPCFAILALLTAKLLLYLLFSFSARAQAPSLSRIPTTTGRSFRPEGLIH
jgi:hypothetical protein